MTRVYLNKEQVLLLHQKLVDDFGGMQGIRDATLLDSAVGRFRSGYYQDEIEEAAALMESLLINHPFLDGNKRIAVSASFVSLMLNGYAVRLNELEAFDFIITLLETNSVSKERVEIWIREKLKSHEIEK
jgi:death-on-curing protein